MFTSNKIRVGVLRGGPSPEYDVSLKTGGHVLKHLPEKYSGVDVLIDKDALWHIHGIPKSIDTVLNKVDVVWNALHGAYGEDGTVQHILQTHAVPFTGSGAFASAVGMNKILSKGVFTKQGIKTPQFTMVRKEENVGAKIDLIFHTFLFPVVVKPATAGSSIGVSIVKEVGELKHAIENAFEHSQMVLVEEFISGREATCGVIENFRGESLYALLPTEIRPVSSGFFDYHSKYVPGQSEEITPGNFSQQEKKIIEEYAKRAHKTLGLRHYSRSDFIVSQKRGVFILETNTLPGLTEESLLPKACAASGIHISHFLDHILQLALV